MSFAGPFSKALAFGLNPKRVERTSSKAASVSGLFNVRSSQAMYLLVAPSAHLAALQPVQVPTKFQKLISTRGPSPALSQAMTIHRLLRNTTFGPEEIARLVTAYEQTLRALRLKDRNDPITLLVAEKIIAIGRLGIEEPTEISKLAVKELGS